MTSLNEFLQRQRAAAATLLSDVAALTDGRTAVTQAQESAVRRTLSVSSRAARERVAAEAVAPAFESHGREMRTRTPEMLAVA